MRGKKYSDEIKEQAYALYAVSGNIAEVSKAIGVPANTISTWIKNKPPDKFDELRDEKKRDFIKQASEIIDIALDRLKTELEDEEKDIPINHLTTAIGTLYDKRALAKGESTDNMSVQIKLPEGADEYAG